MISGKDEIGLDDRGNVEVIFSVMHIKLSFLEQSTLQSPNDDEHGPATQFLGCIDVEIKLISGNSGAHKSNVNGALLLHLKRIINLMFRMVRNE